MAFTTVGFWHDAPQLPLEPRVPLGLDGPIPGAAILRHPFAPRVIAALFALICTYTVFSSLSFWLGSSAVDDGRAMIVDAIQMITPTSAAGADHAVIEQGGQAGAAPVAPVAGASAVDTSTPMPFSILEWSVRPIAAPAPRVARIGTAGLGQGVGTNRGSGTGGNGVYDPYAGASPLRRGGAAGVADAAALARVVAGFRARGQAGHFSCEVIVGLSGQVIDANCTRVSGSLNPQTLAAGLRGVIVFGAAAGQRRERLEIEI